MTDWENKLDDLLEQQEQSEEVQKQKVKVDKAAMTERAEKREQAALFILQTVEPAFGKLAAKLKQRGKKCPYRRGRPFESAESLFYKWKRRIHLCSQHRFEIGNYYSHSMYQI